MHLADSPFLKSHDDNIIFDIGISLLYRQFRLCITALQATPAQGKAHTPLDEYNQRLSLGRAPAIAGERVIVAIIRPLRRLRRHRLAAARSRSGSDTTPWCHSFPSRRFATQRERLFVNPIIPQIGRENKFSAEIRM